MHWRGRSKGKTDGRAARTNRWSKKSKKKNMTAKAKRQGASTKKTDP